MLKKKSEVLSMLLQNMPNISLKEALKKNNRIENIKYMAKNVHNPDSMCKLSKENLQIYDYQEEQTISNITYVPAILFLSKKDFLFLKDFYVSILICSWNDTELGNIQLLPTTKHLLVESHILKIEKSDPRNIFYLENAVCLIRDSYIGG